MITVLVDEGVRACYKQEHGSCALVMFSDGRHSLSSALGAVKQTMLLSGRPNGRVRYRPIQGGVPAHIIVEYTGSLSDDESLSFATAFVNAIKMRG
jgi:hypothetical protein